MPSPRIATKTGIGTGWRSRAACRQSDPELFFPIGNTGQALMQIEEAKQFCRACRVTETCLEWALTVGVIGVWGGTTDAEREAIKRRRQRAAQRATANTTS